MRTQGRNKLTKTSRIFGLEIRGGASLTLTHTQRLRSCLTSIPAAAPEPSSPLCHGPQPVFSCGGFRSRFTPLTLGLLRAPLRAHESALRAPGGAEQRPAPLRSPCPEPLLGGGGSFAQKHRPYDRCTRGLQCSRGVSAAGLGPPPPPPPPGCCPGIAPWLGATLRGHEQPPSIWVVSLPPRCASR